MFAVLVTWLWSVIIFFAFGLLFVRIFRIGKESLNFVDIFFLGFCFTGIVLATISLWVPLNIWVLLFASFFSLFYLVYNYKKRRLSLLTDTLQKLKSLPLLYKIIIGFFLFVTALYSVLPPLNYDTGLYHWQAMLWTESYPVIPGLANLHGRFGFNSNGLLLHTVFSGEDIFGSRVFGLNSLLLSVLFIWLVFKIRQSGLISQIALILFIFIVLRYYDVDLASPVTDFFPNIIISYLLLRAILDYRSLTTVPLLYWTLPLFCVTLKLSMVPFILFSLIVFVWLIKSKQYKTILVACLIGCVIFIPWLIRNVLLTGYLVYPYASIDLFNFDWKVPVSSARLENLSIRAWARVLDPDYEKIINLPFVEWGKLWLIRYFERSKIVILILGLVVVSPLVIIFTQRKNLKKNLSAYYPWLIALFGTIFWLLMAPDVRFAFGYIVFTALAPFMLINKKIEIKFLKNASACLILVFLLFFTGVCANVIQLTKGNRTYQSFLIKPHTMDFGSSVEYNVHQLGDMIIYSPKTNDQCFGRFPCTPFCINCLEMRGKTIQDGFRVKIE